MLEGTAGWTSFGPSISNWGFNFSSSLESKQGKQPIYLAPPKGKKRIKLSETLCSKLADTTQKIKINQLSCS